MDITVSNLTKQYGSQHAVNNISFEVKTGEILGFLGANGAGKTTTMKILTCYMAPTEGDVKIGEYSIHKSPEKIKQHIGYLPEHNPLYLDMPIFEYLSFSAALQNVPKAQIKAKVKEMIVTCGLLPEKHKKIGELSKGYRQRVGLAQAMIHDPDILILDEPTTGLDPNQIIEIRNLIRNIGKEKTVIFSTHILSEVEALCDRVLIINEGKLVADASPQELRKQVSGNDVIKVVIEAGVKDEILLQLSLLPGVALADVGSEANEFSIELNSTDFNKRSIFDLCVKNKWYLTGLTTEEAKLEDIFRKITLKQ